MIVMRAFNVLDGICVQFTTHVTCCASGTCPDPDEVAYASRCHDSYQIDEVVPVLVTILHDALSESGGLAVSGGLQNLLTMHQLH
jgi:hypothetical protein